MAKPSIVIGDGKFATKDTKFLGYAQGDSSSRFVARELDFDRGSNISASRVLPSGLVEKGRVLYAINTTWEGAAEQVKPTGWNDVREGNGTYFPVQGSSGHIKFEITGPDSSSDRYFLQSAGVATTSAGIYATSVYVEAVTGTAPRVRDVVLSVVGSSDTKTNIGFFKNDTEAIEATERVEAGNRYTFVAHLSGTGYHRFGIGTNSDVDEVGSVTLSRPQIETGMVSTTYRENTGSSVVNIGVLEDEARIDYSDNSNGALLLEPQRTNLINFSEYFEGTGWEVDGNGIGSDAIVTTNYAISPEGVKNATRVQLNLNGGTSSLDRSRIKFSAGSTGTTQTSSIYVKSNSGSVNVHVRTIDRIESYTVGETWQRITASHTNGSGYFEFGLHADYNSDTADVCVWGAQVEAGLFATSYIPSYGTDGTRAAEGLPTAGNGVVDMSSFFQGDDFTLVAHFAENPVLSRDGSQGGIRLSDGNDQVGGFRIYRNSDSAKLHVLFDPNDGDPDFGYEIDGTKVAIKRSGNDFKIFVDGSETASFTDAAFDSGLDDLKVWGDGSTLKITKLKLFDEALSDSDMGTETS